MTAMRLILAINAGSSSVKVSVYGPQTNNEEPRALAEASISGLTAPPAKLTYERGDHKIRDQNIQDADSQQGAFKQILKHLEQDDGLSQFKDRNDVEFVCHRIVHGGEYADAQRIDRSTYHRIQALSELAPLHNGPALEIVKSVHDELPNATNVAFFDSAFHNTIPIATRTYAIDPARAEQNGLRKYGFHGLSYGFIARAVAQDLQIAHPNLIVLHLGSGASVCCIRDGKSIDTSMGLTPLAGLPGATRSGDVDPSLVFHFTHEAGNASPLSTKDLHLTTAEVILNKNSGWKAMTGTTDFGLISSRAEAGDEKCKIAFDLFADRIVGYIASYYVKLDGLVDGLVFAGGIGEKGVALRRTVVQKCRCLGFSIDEQKNENASGDAIEIISNGSSRHRVLVVQTDEQSEMARQCMLRAGDLRSHE